MTRPDLNNLRALLDEYERHATSILPIASRRAAAEKLKAAVAEARAALHPSPDGTANYIDAKTIIERLDALKKDAEGR